MLMQRIPVEGTRTASIVPPLSVHNTKFAFTGETRKCFGETLYRIVALRDFGVVKKGEKGGFVAREENLDTDENAWIGGEATVCGEARVSGNAVVYGNALVSMRAKVRGNARVLDNARVLGVAKLSGNVCFCGTAQLLYEEISTGTYSSIKQIYGARGYLARKERLKKKELQVQLRG